MNKTQKILIGSASLLCGMPIIFLTFRNDHNQQKNNLSIEKKEETEIINHQDNQEENKSSSFLFWIMVIVIIIFLIIMGIVAYRYLCKNKNNHQGDITNKDNNQSNINPDLKNVNNGIKNNLGQPSGEKPSEPSIDNDGHKPPIKPENEEDKKKKFACRVAELDLSDPNHKTIKIIFCQSWDEKDFDDFFDLLWKLDVTESKLRNEHKLFYNNFLSISDIKKTIRNFFNLMMNILKMIDVTILKEISQHKEELSKFSKLVELADKVEKQEDKNNFILWPIIHSIYACCTYEPLVNAYQNNDSLSYFKIAMQNENAYFLGPNYNDVPFFYFYSLYRYLLILQKDLDTFLTVN